MKTADVRSLILNTPLREETVTIPGWDGANLLIRELNGKAGADLIAACTDANGKIQQDALVAGIILATLRNADDPNKALVFGYDDRDEPNPAYRDSLMATGLGRIMECAKRSIKLSGLDETALDNAKKDSSGTDAADSLSVSRAA